MKTTIILARHGETQWNLDGRYQGHLDSPLTEKGLMQGRLLSQALQPLKPEIIYASPLGRSWYTAQIIADMYKLPLFEAPGLKEINHGVWQGSTIVEVEDEYPEELSMWRKNPAEFVMPDGESLVVVQKRALQELYRVIEAHQGKTVVLVSHYAPIKTIICRTIGLDLKHFWSLKQDNACINIIEMAKGRWYLKLLNDTCHLGQEFCAHEPKAK